jgi:hypothetical protein
MQAEPRFQMWRPVATTLRVHEAIKLRLRSYNLEIVGNDGKSSRLSQQPGSKASGRKASFKV